MRWWLEADDDDACRMHVHEQLLYVAAIASLEEAVDGCSSA